MARPNFLTEWSKNNAPDPVSDANYEAGWTFIGSEPPLKSQFDFFQNLADKRLLWLGSQLPTDSGAVAKVYATVADMAAATDLVVGLRVRTLGYYAAGDGAGNDYEIVAAATGTPDGGLFINLAGSSTQAKGIFSSYTTVNAKLFGAKGDGIVDDAAAIQAAVDAFDGAEIFLPEGTYRITSPILRSTVGLGDVSVFRITGGVMTKSVIDNQSGDATFRVTSGAGAEFAYNFGLKNLSIISTAGTAGTIGIDMIGCRFVTLENVLIDGMGSHGIYGASTVGDFTDTAHVKASHVQIENCGGYGVYAKTDGDAIQYNWNFYECRIGSNALGGILGESLTNSWFKNCGFYYNGGFGVKIKTGTSGAPESKLVVFEGCEFDTNEGVQLDIEAGSSIKIVSPYLIDNNIIAAPFTVGVKVGALASSVVIEQATPRINPAVTGISVITVENGAKDVVARDSSYQGFIALNGNFYTDNTSDGQFTVDDRSSRNVYYTGTYLMNLKDSTLTRTSSTNKTAYYTVNGNQVTVGVKGLNNIDVNTFFGADIVVMTLPFNVMASDVAFSGSCVITSDSGSGAPIPYTENGLSFASFFRAGSGAFLTASELTDSVSDILVASISYLKD